MKDDLVLHARPRELGTFSVRRALPSMHRRLVGPFVFFDHFGPITFAPGQGMDVRPHPHVNLATVTFLFDDGDDASPPSGEILHRDSLGSEQLIRPGELNWMTAGRGIAHSERSSASTRARGSRLHGIQCWVALPREHEESEPSFYHHVAGALPAVERGGARIRVIAGAAYGVTSPALVLSSLFYAEATFLSGGELTLPDYAERAAYVVTGAIESKAGRIEEGSMLVFGEDSTAVVTAEGPCRVMLLGGAPLEGERHVWWNFVSSSKERIERAKRDWKEGRFGKVPGDEHESIPLPDD
jgi:redox-sensitive bicupin YhaK (pirin superfamily)